MPHASTLMRTCAGPGSEISRSTSSQSPPGLPICAAFIFLFMRIHREYFKVEELFRRNESVRLLTSQRRITVAAWTELLRACIQARPLLNNVSLAATHSFMESTTFGRSL